MKGIRQWLADSYNGIYKIVLEPQNPSGNIIRAVLVAIVFGLIWAYVISPTVFYNAAPYQLSEPARDQWVQMVAAANEAGYYSQQDVINSLNQVEDPIDSIQRMITTTSGRVQQGLQTLLGIVANPDGTPILDANGQPLVTGRIAPQPGGIVGDIISFLIPVVLIFILSFPVAWLWSLLIQPNIVAPIIDKLTPKSEEEKADRKRREEEMQLIRDRKKMEEEMRTASTAAAKDNPYGNPIMQRLSIYTKGRNYDDSFAIEDEDNNFYGETGATIAKEGGSGVTAIEVWLFDKDDFIRTLTKILVTEEVYNDPAARAELEPRVENPQTDIVVVKQGISASLETDQLLVTAKVVEVKTEGGAIDALTIQMEGWAKTLSGNAGTSSTPAATPAPVPAQTYSPPIPTTPDQPPTYTPPMSTPSSSSLPPMPPAMPPPPEKKDDDPFGGTGDFTPTGL